MSALLNNRVWTSELNLIEFRTNANSMCRVDPLLGRVIEALGSNATARMLDCDRSQVSRWNTGTEAISQEMGRRIVDLHDVLTRILRVYEPEMAALWLSGSEPLLGGARPIDVMTIEGAAPVIRAIDGISQGAFA